MFALPKGRKVRTVPLPAGVRDDLAAYLAAFPAHEVTLPWADVDGDPVTAPLLVTSREGKALNRNYVNPSRGSGRWPRSASRTAVRTGCTPCATTTPPCNSMAASTSAR